MTFPCPKGHPSTEPDYCSECGARITGQVPGSDPAPAGNGSLSGLQPGIQPCPECGTPRDPADAVFCEICGYNFLTGATGGLPGFALPDSPAPPSPQNQPAQPDQPDQPAQPDAVPLPAPAATPVHPPVRWAVLATVDAALREPGSPEPPALGPFTFPLTEGANLVGRRSEARAIFPEIPLTYDDAVSHRHALLQLSPEGSLTLRDLGSSNGTRLNGAEIPPLTDHALKAGDDITLGHWSRLLIGEAPESEPEPEPEPEPQP